MILNQNIQILISFGMCAFTELTKLLDTAANLLIITN